MLGFLIAPMTAVWYFPRYCKNNLNCLGSIGKLSLNPFLMTIEASDFKIDGSEGDPLAGFQRLFIEFKPSGLFDRTARFAKLIVERPTINLVIERDGSIKLPVTATQANDAESKEEDQKPPSDPPKFLFESVSVTGGELLVTDTRASSPATLSIKDISLDFKNISTIRKNTGTCSISAKTTASEALQAEGELCLLPFSTKGRISFSGIMAETPWNFISDSLNLDHPSGKLDLSTDYRLDLNGPDLQLVLENLSVGLSGVSLKLRGENRSFFELGKLAVESASFDLASNSLMVGKISAEGGKLHLKAGEDGRMNLDRIVRTTSTAPAAAQSGGSPKPPTHGPGLKIKVDSLELKDFLSEATLDKKATPGPVFETKSLLVNSAELDFKRRDLQVSKVRLDGVHLDAGIDKDGKLNAAILFAGGGNKSTTNVDVPTSHPENAWAFLIKEFELANSRFAFSDYGLSERPIFNITDLNARLENIGGKSPIGVDLKLATDQGGKFAFQGKVNPTSQSVEAKFNLEKLVLTPFEPYLSRFLDLTLKSAAISAEGLLRYAVPESGSKLSYEGSLGVDNLNLLQPSSKEPLFGFAAMRVPSLRLTLEPNKLEVDRIDFAKPFGELIIAEDKTVNLKKLMKEQPATNSAPPREVSKKESAVPAASIGVQKSQGSFSYNIGSIKVEEGKLLFADLSLQPKFMSRIHDLNGTVAKLSSEPGTVSKIVLDGGVDRYGSAKVRGSLDPGDYKRSTDLSLIFRNVEMSSINPYSGKFAGRKIVSGKLSLDLNYKIEGSKLVGDNKIIVDKLVLGEHVNSPDAVNLPLDLALAILSDSNGRIEIGLPVEGDLSNPQFAMGPLIWKAFTSMLTKVVTAPFRALGNLLGGKSEDNFDSIMFDPGRAELEPPEKEKLKRVSEALKEKPLLRLSIVGRYSAEVDSGVLKDLAVRRQIAKRMGIKEANFDVASLDFSDSKTRRTIESMYVEKYGKKGLDEVDNAIKKGEVKARETSRDSAQKKRGKAGIASKLFSATEIYKVVPGMKSPEQSDLLAGELFARLVENEQVPENDLLDLAKNRGHSITLEFEQLGITGIDRIETKEPEAAPGEEGLSAKLVLDSIKARQQ